MKFQFYADEWDELVKYCGFTDDEKSVVSFLRRGWYSADIAEEIHASQRTVERIRSRIGKKIARYIINK